MTDKVAGPDGSALSEGLGRAAWEAWCSAGRRIATPWDLKDKFERAMWVAAAEAAVRAATTIDDLARDVQAEAILLADGWTWDKNRSEWVRPNAKLTGTTRRD